MIPYLVLGKNIILTPGIPLKMQTPEPHEAQWKMESNI